MRAFGFGSLAIVFSLNFLVVVGGALSATLDAIKIHEFSPPLEKI